jgi:Na+/phosphate symporter
MMGVNISKLNSAQRVQYASSLHEREFNNLGNKITALTANHEALIRNQDIAHQAKIAECKKLIEELSRKVEKYNTEFYLNKVKLQEEFESEKRVLIGSRELSRQYFEAARSLVSPIETAKDSNIHTIESAKIHKEAIAA